MWSKALYPLHLQQIVTVTMESRKERSTCSSGEQDHLCLADNSTLKQHHEQICDLET